MVRYGHEGTRLEDCGLTRKDEHLSNADNWLLQPEDERSGLLSARRRDGQTAPPPPPLTILGDKLGGDSCLKCGKNRAVVTGHDVTGATCRGGKEFLSRGRGILLVEPRMANAQQKSTDAYGSHHKFDGFVWLLHYLPQPCLKVSVKACDPLLRG